MRTTLDLPEQLLKDALRVSHCKTKTEVITVALQDLVQRESALGLKKYFGKIHLDIDLDALRKR
jgi:hypothetical protein